ncbi:MAG: hypothetical protein NTY02_15785 [Acidobacteria bacterium]|nr:hypothetical protein [Acidobacteriota bacterium]
MSRSLYNSFASRAWRAAGVALGCVALSSAAWGQTAPRTAAPPPPAGAGSLLSQAASAEAELRIDVAVDRLYELLIEHPGTGDALTARLRLARLQALSGNLPQAILECQLLRDELPADHPLRNEAIELATLLARRLRASVPGQIYFPTFEGVVARGVQAMDESRAIVFEGEARFVLLDEGAGRVYRVGADTATAVAVPQEPSAVAVMPDGSLAVAGKTGLATVPPSRTVPLGGTWGGKARQVKKVRSMAALSDGSLLVIDKDSDGVLKCQAATGVCAQWGPIGKFRVVRVGPTDWVYLLDDRGQSVRVLDASQRQITVVGPIVGGTKLEKIEDLAVDRANGFYLLDTSLKRVCVLHMRTQPDGRLGAVLATTMALPQEGDRAYKNASAVGVSPSGQVYVAGKSSPRMMRFR